MKIVQLIQKPQLRGAEIFSCQLANCLTKYGHTNIIVCLYKGEEQLPFDGTIINLNAIQSKKFFNIKAWRALSQIIKEQKPDIIQCNAGDTIKYAVLSKLFFRWKQPIVFRNASMQSLYIRTFFSKLINGFFYRFSDYIISVSETSKKDFVRLFPFVNNKIAHIPIGVNLVQLDKKLPNDIFTIVHVGGFTYEKNHEGLLRIFKSVLQQTKLNIRLYLVGNGPLLQKMIQLVKKMCLEDNVFFLGAVPAMPVIRQSDLLVLPSLIEGLPAVLIEALYAETAVLAYDVGAIRELLVNQVDCIVEKGNEIAFADAIIKKIKSNTLSKANIDKARNFVQSEYSNELIAEKFFICYKNIVNRTQH